MSFDRFLMDEDQHLKEKEERFVDFPPFLDSRYIVVNNLVTSYELSLVVQYRILYYGIAVVIAGGIIFSGCPIIMMHDISGTR